MQNVEFGTFTNLSETRFIGGIVVEDSSERITLYNLTICHKIIHSSFHYQIKDTVPTVSAGSGEGEERKREEGEEAKEREKEEKKEEKKEAKEEKLEKVIAKVSDVEIMCVYSIVSVCARWSGPALSSCREQIPNSECLFLASSWPKEGARWNALPARRP